MNAIRLAISTGLIKMKTACLITAQWASKTGLPGNGEYFTSTQVSLEKRAKSNTPAGVRTQDLMRSTIQGLLSIRATNCATRADMFGSVAYNKIL